VHCRCPLWAKSGHQVTYSITSSAGEQRGRKIETERFRRPNLFPGGLRNAVIQK